MGIEYRGQLCVGYNYDQMTQVVEEFGSGGDYEDLGFEQFAPYFDAASKDCILVTALHEAMCIHMIR